MSNPQPQVETIEVIPITESSTLHAMIKAEIDVQIATAKAYPRSMTEFLEKSLSMATINEDIAESCSYSLPRGDKTLQGPSVRLAEIVCAAYKNIRAGARIVMNDGRSVTAQGFCHDLENNVMIAVEVKRSIMQNVWEPDPNKPGKKRKTGKMVPMAEDMIIVTGNAACAIAYRNAVFKVIPTALINDIYEKTKKVAVGTEATLVTRRDKAIGYFRALGITDLQICTVLEVKGLEDIDLEKLAILSGFKSAIKNNESRLDEIFAPEKPKEKEKDKPSAATQATVNAIKKTTEEKEKK